MPDSFGVYDDMKVWEYLDFFARCYGIPADRRRRMIGDLLELVDLGPKRDAYVQGLSRGMQQRLCLAHTLVHDPQVLLLDEPASGLDPRARVELRELLRELRSLGKTILVSSHILPELEELCTSVAIIDRGQVLAQGRVADIEKRLRVGAVLRVRVLGDDDDARGGPRLVRGPARRRDGGAARRTARSRSGSTATTTGSARLLAHAVGAGPAGRRRSRGPRATSRSCSSRSRPPTPRSPRQAAGMSASRPPRPPAARFGALRDVGTGIAAVGVKELRGRMRGKRAFVILTIHLLLVAGFAWMIESIAGAQPRGRLRRPRSPPPPRSAASCSWRSCSC